MQDQVLRAMLGYPSPLLGPPPLDLESKKDEVAEGVRNRKRPAPATPTPFESSSLLSSTLSKAELCVINSLVHHGGHLAYLRDFVEKEEHDFGGDSIYLRAIARSIGTLLRRYEDQLMSIHNQLRKDPCLGLEYIRSRAMKHWGWIPHVAKLVEWSKEQESGVSSLPKKDAGGRDQPSSISCAVVDEIGHRMTSCPDETGRRALQLILEAAEAVLWNQCMQWICYGKLSDPANEFFLVFRENVGNGDTEGQDETSPKAVIIYQARIPYSSISFSLANRMLFVGKAVRMMNLYGDKDDGEGDICSGTLHPRPTRTVTRGGEKKPMKLELERIVDSAYRNVSSRLCTMLRTKYDLLRHAGNLRRLFLHGDGLFYSELLRECDAGGIWSIIEEHGTCSVNNSSMGEDEWNILGGERMFQNQVVRRVCSHLDDTGANLDAAMFRKASSFSIRIEKGFEVNLSGRDLLREMFETTQDEVSHLPHTHAVRVALGEAHDRAMSALSWAGGDVPLTLSESENKGNAPTVVLSCEYDLPPVLNDIFPDDVIESLYNSFFRRLFVVHRASYELQKCWRILYQASAAVKSEMVLLYPLRSKMDFFVNNMLAYFHDIASQSFHDLDSAFRDVTEYDELITAHSVFLGAMRRGFLLDDQSFNESLSIILALIHFFSLMVGKVVEGSASKIASGDVISCISERFGLESKNVFQLLCGNPDAAGLCLRLDFNKQYSTS